MANLTPVPGNDNVPQLETSTLALGGPGAPMNSQAQALLNRDAQRQADIAAASAGAAAALAAHEAAPDPHPQYTTEAEVDAKIANLAGESKLYFLAQI
jgi:hypothetical protein